MRERASRTVTRRPARSSSYAAVSPARPAPTTTTCLRDPPDLQPAASETPAAAPAGAGLALPPEPEPRGSEIPRGGAGGYEPPAREPDACQTYGDTRAAKITRSVSSSLSGSGAVTAASGHEVAVSRTNGANS